MFYNLPIVLGNAITQFLTDSDNSHFIISHKNANVLVTTAPRQAEFTINLKSKDLYQKYKNINVDLYCCINQNLIENTHLVVNKLNNIPSSFVKKFTIFNMLKHEYIKGTEKYYEMSIILERINIFHNVHILNVLNYWNFKAYHKFPNLTGIEIIIQIYIYSHYPYIPKLKQLWTIEKEDGKLYHGKGKLSDNWNNITVLSTVLPIPDTFEKLKEIIIFRDPNEIVPDNIAKNITKLTVDNFSGEIDITRFVKLKRLCVYKDAKIIGMRPNIKLIHLM